MLPDPSSINLAGVGTLTNLRTAWYLVYDRCGHSQTIAIEGLEAPESAERFVRRYFADCLTCEGQPSKRQPARRQ